MCRAPHSTQLRSAFIHWQQRHLQGEDAPEASHRFSPIRFPDGPKQYCSSMPAPTSSPEGVGALRLLLDATQHTVDALSEEGRIPPEQAALLRALLLRESERGAPGTASHGRIDAVQAPQGGTAGSSARHNPAAPGGAGVVVGGSSGWAALPEEVEEGIFIVLQKASRNPGSGNDLRLVCKEWKRWVGIPTRMPSVTWRTGRQSAPNTYILSKTRFFVWYCMHSQ